MCSCFYILGDWLLAEDMLPGFNCFFNHGWLNADRQGYDDGIDILAGEKMVEGVAGGGRGIVVYLDGLSRTFGKFVGGCFGARVDGFEGEERGCLDSREMLCSEDIELVIVVDDNDAKHGRGQTLSSENSSSNDGYSD